jgi:sigma-B regulation protein RsbU (phosphoserine phosphatase)
LFAFNPGVSYPHNGELIMQGESLHHEVTKFETEKTALAGKSKLFGRFESMAHSCLRLPSSTEWKSLKNTLQKTLEFSIELTGAEQGSLVLLDSNGVVTESIPTPGDGIPDQGSGLIGQGLNQGLAGWVSCHLRVGLITDTVDDDRWQPLPHPPQTVRSVLAVPILKGRELMGILSLMHSKPQHFRSELVEQMQATSEQIALTLENARSYAKLEASYRSLDHSKKEIEAYSKALDDELENGRQSQKNFLPDNIPRLPNWEIATYFAPAKQVSGDFYDIFSLPGKYLGIVIADVCGKGVGSALYMALIRSLIRVFSGHISLHGFSNFSVDQRAGNMTTVLTATDNQINALNAVKLTNDYIVHEHGKESMFATLFFGVINPLTGVLAYINGGHEPVLIVDSAGVKKSLKPTGPAVGIIPAVKFEIQHAQMESGDILIGYTDGVIDSSTPNGDFFTRKRLLSILKQPPPSASELVEGIRTNIFAHIQNSPQFDDITMLAVQRLSY